METSDVLPLPLLPQLVSLQLKVSYQLDGHHLLPTQRHNLTNIVFLCEILTIFERFSVTITMYHTVTKTHIKETRTSLNANKTDYLIYLIYLKYSFLLYNLRIGLKSENNEPTNLH